MFYVKILITQYLINNYNLSGKLLDINDCIFCYIYNASYRISNNKNGDEKYKIIHCITLIIMRQSLHLNDCKLNKSWVYYMYYMLKNKKETINTIVRVLITLEIKNNKSYNYRFCDIFEC